MARQEEAVVDASTAIKWISREEGTPAALGLREKHIHGETLLSAPDLLVYEITNALRYKPDFDEEKVAQAINSIIDLQIELITPGKELIQRSIKNAYNYDITIYDSCYLALGELLGIKVITSDRKLYDKAKHSENLLLL
jgi:predicted nucleic acid-binding protein